MLSFLRRSRLLLNNAKSLANRSHETKACTINYETVKFQKEHLGSVMNEVPDYNYYEIGGDNVENPFAYVPLTESVLQPEDFIEGPHKYEKPKLRFSKLENGIRVISIDKKGLTANLGLYVKAGSRHEGSGGIGISHMIEMMAWKSTAHISHLRCLKTFETIGAQFDTSVNREHISYHVDVYRQYMPIVLPLMIGNILFPRLLRWEVDDLKDDEREHFKKWHAEKHDEIVTNNLMETAYHRNTLGNALHVSHRSDPYYDGEVLREFMINNYYPDNVAIVGVNVDHDELTKWTMRSFVDYNTVPNQKRVHEQAQYTGGVSLVESNLPMLHVCLGFETTGWNNTEDLVATTVLQTLLGGGGSFSTGGPGKGMHSRLYNNVLNRHYGVDSCQCFNHVHSDSGVFGLYLTGPPEAGVNLVQIAYDEFSKLTKFTDEELTRAKKSLKSAVHMNVETNKVLLEDIGRQFVLSNTYKSPEEFAKQIDKIQASDLVRVVKSFLQTPVTYVAYGNTAHVPQGTEVQGLFGSLKKL